MRLSLFVIITFLLSAFDATGQNRIITGKIIDEDLTAIPEVHIKNANTLLLGKTDINGQFRIDIPLTQKSLSFGWIGFEWTSINLVDSCSQLDVILMRSATYDFMSLKKVDRLRMKRFKKLPELHLAAFQKGIFTTDKACYTQNFISYDKPKEIATTQ